MCTINAQTSFFTLCQRIFTTKILQKNSFLFLLFVLWDVNLIVFNIHIMWPVFINCKQEIYRVFKYLIWNVNWKSQFVVIIKHINANIVLSFNLAKTFFSHRKFNSIIVQIISKLFVILCNSFWMYIYGIKMPNMTP